MVYLGAFPTALAFSTWAYALARMPAGQLGVTTYVVPAIVICHGVSRLRGDPDTAGHRRRCASAWSASRSPDADAMREAVVTPPAQNLAE